MLKISRILNARPEWSDPWNVFAGDITPFVSFMHNIGVNYFMEVSQEELWTLEYAQITPQVASQSMIFKFTTYRKLPYSKKWRVVKVTTAYDATETFNLFTYTP